MLVDDAVLPAAAHLTGPGARRVLQAALDAFGGRLAQTRATHLQYRPGHDVVVRFDSRVRWHGGDPVEETLLAATTHRGPPPGTLPVEAVTPDGATLAVGVWRWPFDPHLTGLADAVTPSSATEFLAGLVSSAVRLEVVAYRPTLRAVVRAVDEAGGTVYLKAIRRADVEDLADRHQRLLEAGVPVPPVLRHDPSRGLIAMGALLGPTIRDRIHRGNVRLPGPTEYERVFTVLGRAHLPSARPVDSRAAAALHHAAMLAAVLPRERERLERLSDLLAPAAERAVARSGPTIHGDLYESQLVTGHRSRSATITGVLDLDDAGPGDPLDDRATVIAHLLNRTVGGRTEKARRVADYASTLHRAFAAGLGDERADLDLAIAGTLVGLATGPFRIQQRNWQQAVRRRLALAESLARRPGEKTLRIRS